MRKILLNKSKGKESVNNVNVIPINFNRDASLFHNEILTETIDTMEVYNNEKNTSKKHRFIFTLYPVLTNSLFNNITEIVYKEGSKDAEMLLNFGKHDLKDAEPISTEPINRIQAIRNTEYSNSVFNLTYHCGTDIFNNHLMRLKEDSSVQKRSEESAKKYICIKSDDNEETTEHDGFNTIGDYSRNFNGNDIITIMPDSSEHYVYKKDDFIKNKTPLYIYDTIKPFIDGYYDNIKRKDGWIGFINPSTLNIKIKDNDYYINKCINSKESCEFIDMTPERDLFYFTPKLNKYMDRYEKNWEYFLTYPYMSVYEDEYILNGNGLPLEKVDEYNSSNNQTLVLLRSFVKHNLNIGDSIKITFSNGEKIICDIVSIGTIESDFKEYYFSVKLSDFIDYVEKDSTPTRFVKVVSGFECEYYFRKFKKINNSEKTELTKLAFADTIYGDEISQIIYNNDINISEYKDNRGRPLTEVYLTILKTNKGHEEWYVSNDYGNENVEYSHVFGKVTSGLDLPPYVSIDYPVIRHQHNINIDNLNADGVVFPETSKKIEEDITSELNEFYGDLVEFNPITVKETVIENIMHRFNTAQRETTNKMYDTLYYDEIYGDFYDGNYYGKELVDKKEKEGTSRPRIIQHKMNKGYANLAPEGYLYKPHYKIKIGEFSDVVKQGSDIVINIYDLIGSGAEIEFKTRINYSLLPNDIIGIMDKTTHKLYQYKVDSYSFDMDDKSYICAASTNKIDVVDPNKDNNYIFFRHNLEIPDYSYMLPDGTGRHLWREIVKPSEYTFSSDLYDIPFTNGAFYHHVNITFLLRRQDPFKKYGMFLSKEGKEIEYNFEIPSEEFDYSIDDYIPENSIPTCF